MKIIKNIRKNFLEIYLIFWYNISSILRTFKLNEVLLKIRRKIRGE